MPWHLGLSDILLSRRALALPHRVPPSSGLTHSTRANGLLPSPLSSVDQKISLLLVCPPQLLFRQVSNLAGYAQRLQKNAKTTNTRNINEERRYIDSAEFWRDQYTKLYDEKKALDDRIHRGEEELRRWRMGQDEDEAPSTSKDFPEGWNEETTFMSVYDEHQLRMSSYRKAPLLLLLFHPLPFLQDI